MGGEQFPKAVCVFAFDAEDHVLAVSPSKSMTAVGAVTIGEFAATGGPASIDASWAPVSVAAACFNYGKLVASATSDNPSYVKGDPYLAMVESPDIAGVQVSGLEPAMLWVRYEYIRSTSMGSFVVGRTAVISVTVE